MCSLEPSDNNQSEEDVENEGEESESEESDSESEDQEGCSANDDEETDASSEEDEAVAGTSKENCESSESGSESDMSDVQADRCAICLSRYLGQELGSPNNCDHTYCAECIVEWSRNMNICPVDRIEFGVIYVRSEIGGPIIRKVAVTRREATEIEDENDVTFCEVCERSDREDRMLLCDGCDSGYHLECLNPPLRTVPIEEWFCPTCSVEDRQNLAEAIEIEDGELNALLDEQPNFNPNLGPRINRTRLIPRTRQSERVRQVIQRRRNTTVTPRKTTKKKGKRKSGTRKRKTKGKRKPKSSWAKSTGSSSSAPVKFKRRRRRRRRRKFKTGRKMNIVRTVSKTPRERIAEQLGMEKIIPKHFLPVVSGTTVQPRFRSSGGGEYGPTSLQLFGSRNELIAFEDSYDEENVSGDVDVHVNRVQRRVKSSLVRASPFEVPSSSFNQTSFDVLGNILSCQTQLQLPSHQIRIGRDGKLHRSSEKSLINRNDNCNRTKRPSDPVNNGPSSNSTPARTVIASTNSNMTTSNNDGQCSVRSTDLFSSNSALSSGSNRGDGDNEGGVGDRTPVEFHPYIGKKKKKVDEEKKKIENDDDIDIYSDIDDVDAVVPEVDPAENISKSGLDELSLIDGDSRISSASNMQADDLGSEIDPGNESAAVDSDDDLVIDESVKPVEDPDEVPRDCANLDVNNSGEEIENNFDRNSEVHNEGDSDANNEGDSEANNEGDSEANNEGDSEANNEGDSEGNNEGDSEANNEGDSEANNEGDSEANNEEDYEANNETDSAVNNNFKESPDSPIDDEGLLQTEDISSEEEPIMDDEEKIEKPSNDNENEENDELEGEKSENESSNENNEEDEVEAEPEVDEDDEEEGVNKESEQNEENEEMEVPSKEENPEQEEDEEEEEEEEVEQAEGEESEFQPDEEDFELEKDILEEDPPADENVENDEDEVEIIEQVEGGREVIEDDEVIVTEVRNVGKNRVKSDRTVSRRRERRKSGESNNSGHSRRRRSPYHSLNSSSNRRSSSRNRHGRSGRHDGESHDDHSHKSKSGSSSTSKFSRRHQTDDHHRTNEPSSKSGKHHERKNESERQNEEREHDKSQFQQQQNESGDAQNEESGNTSGDKNLNNEISWKKLSQSTKTRNYRDNRTKLEQHHMRLMEKQKRERDRQSRSSPTVAPPPPPPPVSQLAMHPTSSHPHTSPTITNSYEKGEKQQRRERKHSEHRHEKDQRSNSSSNRRDSNERRHVEKRKISSNTSSSGGSGRDGSRLKEHRRRDSSNRENHSTRDRNKERRDRKEAKKEKIKRELERIEREEKHRERKRERAAAAGLLSSPSGNHSPSLLHHHHHPQPPLPPSSPPSNSPINASPPSTIESKEVYASGDKIIINVNFGRCKNKEARSGKKRHHQQEPASGEEENANGEKEVKSKKRSKYDHYRPKGIQSPPTPPWNPFASTDTMDENSKDNEGEEDIDEDEEENNGSDVNEDEVNENASESSCEEEGEVEDKVRGREEEENQSPQDSIDEDLIDLELENISSFPKRDEKSEKHDIKSPMAAGEEGEGEGTEEANSAYDPFEPTKSPSDKNEADNKRISNEVPPPLPPELPPLPPEPAPEDPSTNTTNVASHTNNSKLEFQSAGGASNIQHTSTGSNLNFPATLNLSLAPPPNTVLQPPPTPISLANIRIPPPNYLSRPPPQMSNFTWPIGAAAAAANMLFRPNFLSHPPPPIHTGTASGANANSNQAAAAAAATQIRTLLHNQAAQLALLSSLRPTLPPQMTLQHPPQFTIPTSLPQNLAAVAAAVASTAPTLNTNTTSGVNGDAGKQQIDTTEVVDMDVESPYSPGDTLDSASNSQNISDSNTHGHAHHSETKKGSFDSLLPATSSQSRKENVPTRFSGGGSKSGKSGSGKSGSSHRSHRNKTDSHRKHIVRFEMTGGAKTAHGGSAMSGNAGATGGKKDDGKKEVVAKMDESQLKILDELPSSAVEMQVKEKFLKKLNRQERVIEEVKLAVKPYYNRREINKDEYKEILRKSVPKICHNKSGEINPVKIKALVEGYVKKFKYQHKKDGKGGGKRS